MSTVARIRAAGIGPVARADIRFGDLTVFVGPQATGKGVFLQILKLLADKASIQAQMRRFGIAWDGNPGDFLDLYFGEGMSGLWRPDSSRLADGSRPVDLARMGRGRRPKDGAHPSETLFFIPAQRVISLRDGTTRPFTDYRAGDPFVLREFSERLHWIVQNESGRDRRLFPQKNFLDEQLRRPLQEHVFGGYELRTDAAQLQRRIVLRRGEERPLPCLVWSAGQRGFAPLLLGLHWLLPPGGTPRRDALRQVVIEEPEMGLHPNGVSAVLVLVFELLARGYRVCLSTHSPHVLDVVWALTFFQENGGAPPDVLKLFKLRSVRRTRSLAEKALASAFKVYFFARDGVVRDISRLDPGADGREEAGWGGLTEFSGDVGDVVAEVAARRRRMARGKAGVGARPSRPRRSRPPAAAGPDMPRRRLALP